jgi:hypothetical protein
MTSIVLLALIANTYFVQPNYSCQWDTLVHSVAVECYSVRVTFVVPVGKADEYPEASAFPTRGKLGINTTCKRPRDYLLHNYVQRDKTA